MSRPKTVTLPRAAIVSLREKLRRETRTQWFGVGIDPIHIGDYEFQSSPNAPIVVAFWQDGIFYSRAFGGFIAIHVNPYGLSQWRGLANKPEEA